MTMTPQDIHDVKFRTKMRGYDEVQVDDYLDQIAERMAALQAENEEYQKKLTLAVEQLNYLKGLEQTLRDTMLTAQRSADETIRAAQKRGEGIVRQAEEQADDVRKKAREEAAAVTRNLETLRVQSKTYARQFRTLMNAQLRLLEEHGLGEDNLQKGKGLHEPDDSDTGEEPEQDEE